MFDFLRKSGLRRPSASIVRALEADGLPPGADVSALGLAESPGTYAGRRVTYFRIFDPQGAAARAVNVLTSYTYQDLNSHLDLVLRAGHIERDGTVVVWSRSPMPDAAIPARARADRADRPDDARVVLPRGDR